MIIKTPKYFLDDIVAPACDSDKDILQAFTTAYWYGADYLSSNNSCYNA